jgi:glycine/betaine/sarcosine/D-proline reductase family selenoprotein B
VVVITALPDVQRSMGVNRIVAGVAITSLLGDPALAPAAERTQRERLVRTALGALERKVEGPTVIEGGS